MSEAEKWADDRIIALAEKYNCHVDGFDCWRDDFEAAYTAGQAAERERAAHKAITFIDWTRALAADQFYPLQIAGYPGWNLADKKEKLCYSHFFNCTKGEGESSREMAVKFDSVAEGNFYYRDWTESSLPFVSDGETYKSRFWFQYKADYDKFAEMFAAAIRKGEGT